MSRHKQLLRVIVSYYDSQKSQKRVLSKSNAANSVLWEVLSTRFVGDQHFLF